MGTTASIPINAGATYTTTCGRLFFLALSAGRVLSANPDGSDLKTIINEGRKLPYKHLHQLFSVPERRFDRASLGAQVFDVADIERCECLLDEPRILRVQEFTRGHIGGSDHQGVSAAL